MAHMSSSCRRIHVIAAVILVYIMSSSCGDPGAESVESGVCENQPALVQPSPSATFLQKHTKSTELLVNASFRSMPLTKQGFYLGKFLDTSAQKITIRAYTSSGVAVDYFKARAAERAARRALYGAWSPSNHARLTKAKPTDKFKANLWVPFARKNGAKSALKAAAFAAKTPVRLAMSKKGIKELWSDPKAPIVVVEGTAAALLTLGSQAGVGHATLVDESYTSKALGDAQEKVDMGFPLLEEAHPPAMENAKVVHWDSCLPSTSVSERSISSNKMAYIPLSRSNFSNIPFSQRDSWPGTLCLAEDRRHVEQCTGIIAGRRDTGYPSARGFDSFLYKLDEIRVATVMDIGSGGVVDPNLFMNRLATVFQWLPDVQSFSISGPGISICDPAPKTWMLYLDYLSLQYPSLFVAAAGNSGEDVTCTGLYKHYVEPKFRNGIIVGAHWRHYGGVDSMFDSDPITGHLENYSSWRPGVQPGEDQGDRRLPHFTAEGTYIQSFDNTWRSGEVQAYPDPDDPYRRCHKEDDFPFTEETDDDKHQYRGTSFSSPQVAAVGTYAMRQSVCHYPEDRLRAVENARALLILSADRLVKVQPESTEQCNGSPCPYQVYPLTTGYGVDWTDRRWAAGAGAMNAARLSWLMGAPCTAPGSPPEPPEGGDYGGDTHTFPPEGPMPLPKGGSEYSSGGRNRCRVAIAWNPEPSCSGGSPPCSENMGYDYDVCLKNKTTGVILACATSYDNNYEVIDINCPANADVEYMYYPVWGTAGHTIRIGRAFYVQPW